MAAQQQQVCMRHYAKLQMKNATGSKDVFKTQRAGSTTFVYRNSRRSNNMLNFMVLCYVMRSVITVVTGGSLFLNAHQSFSAFHTVMTVINHNHSVNKLFVRPITVLQSVQLHRQAHALYYQKSGQFLGQLDQEYR